MTSEGRPPTLDWVASLLDAYLQSPGLPAEVELCCLRAAAELQRAGAIVTPIGDTASQVTLIDITSTLQQLPQAVFDTDPVLNAVAELTTAASALDSP